MTRTVIRTSAVAHGGIEISMGSANALDLRRHPTEAAAWFPIAPGDIVDFETRRVTVTPTETRSEITEVERLRLCATEHGLIWEVPHA
jgi:hypothetical protein